MFNVSGTLTSYISAWNLKLSSLNGYFPIESIITGGVRRPKALFNQ
jgi:hypothetical protein